MGVAVGNVDTLMPYPVSDCQGGKAHINQQGNVRMSEVVNPDPLHSRRFRTPVHFMVEIVLADRENPFIYPGAVKRL